MRNLLDFLYKNYVFLVFALLQFVSFYLIANNTYYQRASIVNSANAVTGGVYKEYASANEYVSLRSQNEALSKENAMLHNMLVETHLDLTKLSQLRNDTLYKQQYHYFTAKVINNTVSARNNYITINKGTLQGVKRDMAVIGASGIVGIVQNVSPHYCTAMSLLHKDSRISARIKKNEYFGSLTWSGANYEYADLNDIPKHVKLTKGDTIVTSAYSSIFPEGIIIGRIDKFEIQDAANFYNIRVKLATDYKKLTHVYMVENLLKQELDTLEAKSKENGNDN
ncbi:MAG: rod shape-determining protein MreC [Bacteroidia bacterium]|nr:rod shape-determining protein MreC [Bacteroidia bacterium]